MLDFILSTVFRFVCALAGKLVHLVFLGWSHYCITFPDLVKDPFFFLQHACHGLHTKIIEI